MKVCFCGLGSVGKRHLLNLRRICRERSIGLEIHAYRGTDRVLPDEIAAQLSRQITDAAALDPDYDIVFVTNPTALHYGTIREMCGRTRSMFIEKPVFDGTKLCADKLPLNAQGVYYVAGPLRYSSVIQKLRQEIAVETVYCARAICSSYLPDWRPNADYRQVYSAKKELGGGVAVDLIHEWDYLVSLFGFPQSVYRVSGKYSRLEIDSDDLALYIAAYADKAVEIHLDYFGRVPRREIEFFTQNGTIKGDLIKRSIEFSDCRASVRFVEEENDLYLREMNFFIGQVLSGRSYSNIDHSIRVLKLALGKESV